MSPAHSRIPTPHTRQFTQLLAGENNHHMAESSFKALGLALRQVVPLVFAAGSFCFPSHILAMKAVSSDVGVGVPSTKGSL
jgi:imidazoleglycerol phosphate dehydratase HisB